MPEAPKSKGKIIVFGILFWYPLAGVTYQFLHYLIGLRRLGYDPYYIEDSGRWIYDPRINEFSPDVTGNLAMVVPYLQAHGFGDRWAFRGNYPDGKCYGRTEEHILQLYREADAFLNVTGAQEGRRAGRGDQEQPGLEQHPPHDDPERARGRRAGARRRDGEMQGEPRRGLRQAVGGQPVGPAGPPAHPRAAAGGDQ